MRERRKNWKGRRNSNKAHVIKLGVSVGNWSYPLGFWTTWGTVLDVSHNCPSNWQRLGQLSTNFFRSSRGHTNRAWATASSKQKQAFTINHMVSISFLAWPKFSVILIKSIFQGLRDYLPGSVQASLFFGMCTVSIPKPTESTLYCTCLART